VSRFDIARSVSKAQAMAAVPGPDGKRYRELFRHGTLQVEIYRPVGTDPQSPHTRDEAYLVIEGTGTFVIEGNRLPLGAGDFLFAPASVPHRFERFSEDFAVWVLFYGPEGGEK
jgi:mannose-6-phosphate isomerase-like protein (cupin superfamily)